MSSACSLGGEGEGTPCYHGVGVAADNEAVLLGEGLGVDVVAEERRPSPGTGGVARRSRPCIATGQNPSWVYSLTPSTSMAIGAGWFPLKEHLLL